MTITNNTNTTFRVVDEVPSSVYFIWNIGSKYAPEGHIPLCRLDPREPAGTTKIDPDDLLALPVKDEADRELIMSAASAGVCDVKAAVELIESTDKDKLKPGSYDESAYDRVVAALPALKRLPWDPERTKYCR